MSKNLFSASRFFSGFFSRSFSRFFSRFLAFAFLVSGVFSIDAAAQFIQSFAAIAETKPAFKASSPNNFANPVIKIAGAACAADNLRAERFAADLTVGERVRICQALDAVTNKLNRTAWSPELFAELKSVWQTFSAEAVTLRPMPHGTSSRILAMAEPFPADSRNGGNFTAAVYVRAEKSDNTSFFPILFHELRHVLDFYETWKNKTAVSSMEIERRAYLLMGKLTRETPEKEKFAGVPKFWKESWRSRSEAEIAEKREAAIQKYLRGKKLYRDLANDPTRRTLDFSYLKTATESNGQKLIPVDNKIIVSANNKVAVPVDNKIAAYNEKEGERLPNQLPLPPTATILAQNVQQTSLDLEKPRNPRDEKEILRAALNNEKKLYYGMSNFVYDQNIDFQCLKKGRVSASFSENTTVARTDDGDALFNLSNAPSALPCVLNYDNLKTDFTDTFWASPALEKMPIYFSGFSEVDGKTLAVYTVLQPDAKRFAELADEYPHIRPFRVIVGTIYVSPEDGQIVRFAGTSFPEENVTGNYAQKVRCTYLVKAARQKLNIEGGLWVTVHVGTVAVASVQGKVQPFNYTVKFENYRQSETDVKILDDEAVAGNIAR